MQEERISEYRIGTAIVGFRRYIRCFRREQNPGLDLALGAQSINIKYHGFFFPIDMRRAELKLMLEHLGGPSYFFLECFFLYFLFVELTLVSSNTVWFINPL